LDPAHLVELRKQVGDAYQPETDIVFPAGSLGHLFNHCAGLAKDLERAPSRVTGAALQALESLDNDSVGIFDEREYFKAELAWMLGVAARFQGHLNHACHWFDRAERDFLDTLYPDFGLAKIAFSRLAILYLNYRFDEVIAESQRVRDVLNRLGMPMWAAKCQHVEAMSQKISGRPGRALELLRPLMDEPLVQARPLFRSRVLTQVADSLVELGRHEEAVGPLRSAADLVKGTAPSASSADFWTVLGGLLSTQAMYSEALEVFRCAKVQYVSIEMLGLAAYVGMLISEVALRLGLPSDAADELRWALPILRREGRIPEGCAAAALLEESLKQKDLDSSSIRALRETIQRRNPSHT
jgi:hypothetical protein